MFDSVPLPPRRYGGVVEDYLDVYLRTPDLPKDDIARALVARGRARKGAGQRLLLMASRGLSHPFVVLNSYFADRVPSSSVIDSSRYRLPDCIDIRPFKPRAPVLLASGARCSSFCSPQSNHKHKSAYLPPFSYTFRPSPPPNAFPPKFGTRSRASSPDTSSARGFLYPLSIAILLSVASSARLTFISARTRTTGTEHSTFSTESRRTQSSRAGLKLSAFIGHMTMVTCSMLCLVGVMFSVVRPLLTFSS